MEAAPALRTVPVWDALVRSCHWLLVANVTLAWLTRHGGGTWHEGFGYATLVIIAVRVGWGWLGPATARFGGFVRGPRKTLAYARRVLAHDEPRYVGHNPLGAWMIVALLAAVLAASGSGWLYTTDRFWGDPDAEAWHGALANALLGLVALHVAGVVFTSRRQRENLVAAMLHGRKRPKADGDV